VSDIYEFTMAMDLRDDLSDEEVAELRWHLGLGPRPDVLSIVLDFPEVVENELGEPTIEDHPHPVLGQHDAAWKVGGTLSSELVRCEGRASSGWTLTARQELHPDEFDEVSVLLCWLAAKSDDKHVNADGSMCVGFLRFYEDDDPQPLTIKNGVVGWQA
jgi:hypothetical protein